MRVPLTKTLMAAFPHLDRKSANRIRALAHAVDNRYKLEALVAKCDRTYSYVRSLYSSPYDSHMWRVTVALHAIDVLMETHGVEAIEYNQDRDTSPKYEYLNSGETYAATLIYSRDSENLFIGSYGAIVERAGC